MRGQLTDRWPALSLLAIGYFNEEWPEEYETATEAVDAFLLRNAGFGPQLAEEIDDLLTVVVEHRLPAKFEELDLLVDPGLDLNTHRGWLTGVARRSAAETLNASDVSDLVRPFRMDSWTSLSELGRSQFGASWRERTFSCTRLVVEEFMCEQPDLARKLPDEINALLDLYDEEELGPVLRALGIDYEPTESLNTNKGWLTEVARRVQMPLDS